MTIEQARDYLNKIDFNVEWADGEKAAIDALTAKEETSIEPVHLQQALQDTCLKVDGSSDMSFSTLLDTFSQHVQVVEGSWQLKLVSSDSPDWIKKMVDKPKDNDLAYFIQKVSQFINYNVAKGYGQKSDVVDVVSADAVFGQQTKRALDGLKYWVEHKNDKATFLSIQDLNTLKDKKNLPEGIEYRDGDFVAKDGYERIDPYGTNYAVRKLGEQNVVKDAQSDNHAVTIDSEPFGNKTFDAMLKRIEQDVIGKLGKDAKGYFVSLVDRNDPTIGVKLIKHPYNKTFTIDLNVYQNDGGMDLDKIKQDIVCWIDEAQVESDKLAEKNKKMNDWIAAIRGTTYTIDQLFKGLGGKRRQQYDTFFSKFDSNAIKIDRSPQYTRFDSNRKYVVFDLDQKGFWDDGHVKNISIPVEKLFDDSGNPKPPTEQLKVLAEIVKKIIEDPKNGYVA